MNAERLRQRPLRDRLEDSELFVAPAGYEKALWAAREGLNTLILGAPGQGKTSVLHQLEMALRSAEAQRPPVFVDLAAARSVDVALQLIVSAAAEATAEALRWSPQAPLPNEDPAESRTRTWLAQTLRLRPCAFVIDNLDAERVGFALFGTFRDRLWESPHQWIVAGDRAAGRRWLLRPPADSFWEETIDLNYTEEAAHEMIVRRLGSDPDWSGPIVENVGTNPRQLLRAALATLAGRQAPDSPPSAGLPEWEEWHRRLAQLGRRPSMLMAELSTRPAVSASDQELLSSLGWARTTLLRVLEQLEQDGLVESWSEPSGASGRPRRLFTTTEPGRPRRG